jgi:hypothetical protein
MPMTEQSVKKAVQISEIIFPGHDRPFRVANGSIEYISDVDYHFNFQFDPAGSDIEMAISTSLKANEKDYFVL